MTWFLRLMIVFFAVTFAVSPAMAAGLSVSRPENEFNHSARVSDGDLEKQRGGFMVGGLQVDFAINTRTLVDGITQAQTSISSLNLPGVSPSDLSQLIQVGGGNNSATLNAMAGNQALLTIVQNTKDNTLIQQFNDLALTVGGLKNFQDGVLLQQLDFHAANLTR